MRKFLVPECVWHLQVAELPGPARLHPVMRAVGVQTLQDLNGRRLAELRQQRNCGARTIAALDELLQRAVAGEFDSSPVEGTNAFEALLNLIEAAIRRLPRHDRRLVLERIGKGGSVPLTLEQLGTPRGLTRQGIRSILQKLFPEIRKTFGNRIPRLLYRVREYCISNVCPLTPQLLQDLAPDFQSQLRLSPEAHVRAIVALDESIPCWPNGHEVPKNVCDDSRDLGVRLATIASDAGGSISVARAYRRLRTQRGYQLLKVREFLRLLRTARRIRLQFDNPQSPTIRRFRRLIHRRRASSYHKELGKSQIRHAQK